MRNIKILKVMFAFLVFCTTLNAGNYYEIEIAYNDELFVINGEKYEAKTYCLGWDEGDYIMFIKGSPYGTCTSATLYNKNKKETCEVWCE
ncbi:MAG: hypothetical protein LBD84_01975 [Campylobacteraceae bacterium]|jgi:hypothetical protein|nr:hypothetical protein [Campylobacteraceae bacterium]